MRAGTRPSAQADAARQLYLNGTARQWNPVAGVPWNDPFRLLAEIEGAVV